MEGGSKMGSVLIVFHSAYLVSWSNGKHFSLLQYFLALFRNQNASCSTFSSFHFAYKDSIQQWYNSFAQLDKEQRGQI